MVVAKQRHDRALIVAHSKLIAAMISNEQVDILTFIRCGQLGGFVPMPYMPEVEKLAAEVERNGGKLIIPTEG
jgi:hypothetical protein